MSKRTALNGLGLFVLFAGAWIAVRAFLRRMPRIESGEAQLADPLGARLYMNTPAA